MIDPLDRRRSRVYNPIKMNGDTDTPEIPEMTILSTKTDRYGLTTYIVGCDDLRFKIEECAEYGAAYIEPIEPPGNYDAYRRAYHATTSVGYKAGRTLDEALSALAEEIAWF